MERERERENKWSTEKGLRGPCESETEGHEILGQVSPALHSDREPILGIWQATQGGSQGHKLHQGQVKHSFTSSLSYSLSLWRSTLSCCRFRSLNVLSELLHIRINNTKWHWKTIFTHYFLLTTSYLVCCGVFLEWKKTKPWHHNLWCLWSILRRFFESSMKSSIEKAVIIYMPYAR